MDNRKVDRQLIYESEKEKRYLTVNPDIVGDFTEMPFKDESFYLIVFDPPHLKNVGENSWMAKKYGKVPRDWQEMIKKGFDECMRCLKPNGTLIFKWSEHDISVKEVVDAVGKTPLFGHPTGQNGKTIWMTFMK